ncbi:MAG: cobalamin-binding protein [Chloroflexi bacterium]|nr:cobalamin-binding protein [Chloroflexota bacterium]
MLRFQPKLGAWSIAALLIMTLMLGACGDTTNTTAPTTVAASAATTAATTTAATTAKTSSAATTAPSGSKAGATVYPLTVTDDAKRSVKFEKMPSKIASLSPGTTELLYALDLGDRVVGVDEYSDYPAEAKQKEKVGGYKETNIERVVSLSTDLVLAAGITSKQLISSLEARGLTVLILNPSNLAGVLANIKLLAQVTNVPDKGNVVAADFQKKLDDVAAKIKGAKAQPRVFYELDPTLFTIAPGSFVDDMLQKAGGQNIVTDATNPYPQLNQEAVIAKDPEVILLGDDSAGTDTPEKIMARPGWSNISAIKNKRVYVLEASLVSRPGPRAALGVENIAKTLYPDLFK